MTTAVIFNLEGILLGAVVGAVVSIFIAQIRMDISNRNIKRNYLNNILKFNDKIKDYETKNFTSNDERTRV